MSKTIDNINQIREEAEEKLSKIEKEVNTTLLAYKLVSTVCKCIIDFLKENEHNFNYKEVDPITFVKEVTHKEVDHRRMELSCRCPHCSEPVLFLLTSELEIDKNKIWKCLNCKNEFKIGEY